MSLQKKILKNSVFMLFTNGIGKGTELLSNILIARLFGPSDLGSYIYVYSYLLLFRPLALFGADQSLLQFIPRIEVDKDEELKENLQSFSILLTTILGLFFSLINIIFSNYIAIHILNNIKYTAMIRSLGIYIFIYSIATLLETIFQAQRNYFVYSISRNILQPFIFVFLIIVLNMYSNLENPNILVYARNISVLIPVVLLIYILKKHKFKFHISSRFINNYRQFLYFSLPLFLSSFVSLIVNKANTLMVGYYLSDIDIAIFSIATQIALLISFVLASVNQVFAPIISKLYFENNIKLIEDLYNKITLVLTIISTFLFVIILILNKFIMGMFGNDFITGGYVLIIISFGQLINAISGPSGYINTMTGHPEYELIINSIALILNIILNIMFIPKFGIIGAAYIFMIILLFTNITRYILLLKNLKFKPFSFLYQLHDLMFIGGKK